MTNYALLNNVDHKDVRVITERSAKYGDDVMYAMTFAAEFRSVQAYYPILFQRDANDDFYPVALFGFQEGENLFLDEAGWHASYVPATIRREPFLIGYQKSKENPDAEAVRVLSIDMDHPRVNEEEGEALFQPLGGRTPFLEDTADLLEQIYLGLAQNRSFAEALQEFELIESVTFDIALNDGSRNKLLGFHAINEEKLQRLSGNALEDLRRKGFLMPLFMMLASTANIRTLMEMKNRLLEG